MYLPKSENDLIQNYLPDYYKSDEVARLDILTRYLDGELTDEECKEYELFEKENIEKQFHELSEKLFSLALRTYALLACEQQRELCVRNYFSRMHNDSPSDNIRFALPPKFE